MKLFNVDRFAKILLFFTMLLIAEIGYAQKDVTRFLGIPVDGDKATMIRNLKAKGFEISKYNSSVLVGEFNGRKVYVSIGTNNNKVCRIMVTEVNGLSESDIKINFNKLYTQFKNNKNYISTATTDQIIPEEENIFLEMNAKNKRYEASFYQKPDLADSSKLATELRVYLSEKYSSDQLANPSAEQKEQMLKDGVSYMADKISMKSVWFMIDYRLDKYYITLFYDNEYNRANGDDL